MRLTDLPDYPALKKLAEALWRQDTKKHGAAIMIGAGFSRSCANHVDGCTRIPLWNDLARKLAIELNGEVNDLTFADPLKLAEEYRAYFGDAALSDFIRAEIQDEAWLPGDGYNGLLTLPWADILTTNWDTLLERAAINIHYPIYGVVSKQSDLASISQPRIVKLHGTAGKSEKLIFSKEDYRRYPIEYAAFVNFARQVFIENELCLLGFSGDDPNFLQWAGWVRDHLSTKARRIYLVGALKLNSAKRKLLESMNIAPVDIWDMVSDLEDPDDAHRKATEIFLGAMADLMPTPIQDWMPKSIGSEVISQDENERIRLDENFAAMKLESQIGVLEKDRETYPGWLVCPHGLRWSIENQLSHPYPNKKNISAMSEQGREKLLYEMYWRYETAMTFSPKWLLETLGGVLDQSIGANLSKKKKIEILIFLLKSYRRNRNFSEFEIVESLLRNEIEHFPDLRAEIAYQRAIKARDNFDYPSLEDELGEIQGEDPIWRLRKAGLLAELGRFNEAKILVAEAYKELLERNRSGPGSIKVVSRLAWASWVLRISDFSGRHSENENIMQTYMSLLCDPRASLEQLRSEISRKQQQIIINAEDVEPLFERGQYLDNSVSLQASDNSSALQFLYCLSENAGLPLRWGNVDVLAGSAEQILLFIGVEDVYERLTLALRVARGEDSLAFKKIFTRIDVANFPLDAVIDLSKKSKFAIDYWRIRAASLDLDLRFHAIERIRIHAEALARLTARMDIEGSREIFKWTLGLAKEQALNHRWLHKAIMHLADYSLNSIPDFAKPDLLEDALSFPLPDEIIASGSKVSVDYPNPIIEHPGARPDSPGIDARIDEIIKYIRPGGDSSALALLRIIPLVKCDFLKKSELDALAKNIWGSPPSYRPLPDIDLFPHALLSLPAEDREKVYETFREVIYNFTATQFAGVAQLRAIIGAALNREHPILPTHEVARRLFDLMVCWRPQVEGADLLGVAARRNSSVLDGIGEALYHSVVPSLDISDRNFERYNKLSLFFEETKSPALISSLVFFANIGPNVCSLLEKLLRSGIHSRIPDEVGWSVEALYRWRHLSSADSVAHPPQSLISRVIYLIESGRVIGLYHLLGCAIRFVREGWLSIDEKKILAESVPSIFEENDYSKIKPGSREAITASMIRECCVKLAVMLQGDFHFKELAGLIEKAKDDALPEVRFAV